MLPIILMCFAFLQKITKMFNGPMRMKHGPWQERSLNYYGNILNRRLADEIKRVSHERQLSQAGLQKSRPIYDRKSSLHLRLRQRSKQQSHVVLPQNELIHHVVLLFQSCKPTGELYLAA